MRESYRKSLTWLAVLVTGALVCAWAFPRAFPFFPANWQVSRVEAEKIARSARNADKTLISGARVFDLYAGKGVPEGKKSLAIAVALQPTTATLTDAEIESAAAKIVAAVAKATGATLRS